ncbi:MAG: M56 family metallopeptidase [Bacteroidales bacterium]|nr:M56 family metallopeptidase [Bacteroidales bacterium]MCF8345164.1 M56 family metallopeptidase [Bacteroidales bacterium]MCF8351100.1 M56 family metallopeptidase [Bacteroidales bacterium]
MNELLAYLIKAALAMSIFYGFYHIGLRNQTNFRLIRTYLLSSIIFSLLLPLVRISFKPETASSAYYYLLNSITVGPGDFIKETGESLSFFQLLFIAYLAVAFLMLISFLFRLSRILILISQHRIHKIDGYKYVLINDKLSPFSFFNLIFINRKLLNTEAFNKINRHEQIHIRQFHSVDILLTELLQVIFWFNPVTRLYKRSLQELHEFLADEESIKQTEEAVQYQQLLLNQAFGMQISTLTNNFNQSTLKRRFMMMNKSKSKNKTILRLLLVLPFSLLLAFTFSINKDLLGKAKTEGPVFEPVVAPTGLMIGTTQKVEKPQKQEDDDEIFVVVEQMPEFKDGRKGLYKYLAEKITYPSEAMKKNIEGKVYVTFVIEKDGSVSNVRILRGADDLLDAEAIRVVANMPKWKPGKGEDGKVVRVQYNLPIVFSLGDDKKEEKKEE